MAMLGMVGFTVLMFEGLKRTAAADAGIITATLPAVAAILGAVFAGDRPSRLQGLAIVLAVAAIALVQVAGAAPGTSTLVGNLLIGGAVLCEASFVLLGKRLAPPYRPLRLALGANLVGLALSIPLAMPQLPAFAPASVPVGDVGARPLVCARLQRGVPVAVVSRSAACRDLACRPGDGCSPGGGPCRLGALSQRGDRTAATRGGRAGDRRDRARRTGTLGAGKRRCEGWSAMMSARNAGKD